MDSQTWAIVAATFLGPVLAVAVTLWRQWSDQRYNRRLDVFRTMMKQRRAWITPEWVGALNLVQVEYSSRPEVIDAFSRLLDRYTDPSWQGTPAQRQTASENAEIAASELLQRMARVLKIDLRGADLRRAYLPAGWNSDDQENRLLRTGLIQLVANKRALRVQIVDETQNSAPIPDEQLPPR